MKNIILMVLMLIAGDLAAQSSTEKITKELSFEKKSPDNAVIIANINGHIKVEGYEGDKIIVEVNKTVRGKTQARLDKGKQEIQLGVIDRADTLILFVESPCNKFGRFRSKNNDRWNGEGWRYNWNNNCENCTEEYDYTMDFTVKVPSSVSVAVSTVNEGDISVANVRGSVLANNVNGSIKLQSLMREAVASTINGDVDIEYTKNPQKDCRFYSLNGDINAWFQKGLAANMSFESFNGSFYTNIDKLDALPVAVEKDNTEKGVKYKVSDNRYKIGSGGTAFLDFETFNGNVYLKEK